jgi:hypothetical protein
MNNQLFLEVFLSTSEDAASKRPAAEFLRNAPALPKKPYQVKLSEICFMPLCLFKTIEL